MEDLNSRAANWQTPSVADTTGGRMSRSGSRSGELLLKGQASAWATPNARDRKSEDGTHSPDHLPPLGRQVLRETGAESPSTSTRRLNPAFVEWLMGFPKNWSLPCDTE